jgi:hypothetical protein
MSSPLLPPSSPTLPPALPPGPVAFFFFARDFFFG